MAKIDEKISAVREELAKAKKAKLPKAENLSKRLEKMIAERNTKEELKYVSLTRAHAGRTQTSTFQPVLTQPNLCMNKSA